MTGEKVGSDYFKHNKWSYMGSNLRTMKSLANTNEGLLDRYTGRLPRLRKKRTITPF